MTKTTRKQILCGILALLMMLTVLSGVAIASPDEEASPAPCCYDCVRDGYSIDDIREILNGDRQVYQDFRVHYPGRVDVATYRVPVDESELKRIIDVYDGNVQPLQERNLIFERIRYSERSHAESIVIILFGDGFTQNQFGDLKNLEEETALWHAERAITTMVNTHPFGLFEDLFTVYMIQPYEDLGTIMPDGVSFVGMNNANMVDRTEIRRLADSLVYRQYQNMIQVISNSSGGGGFAWIWNWTGYNHHHNIAVTSIDRPRNQPTTNRTDWHDIFLHEFAHSFGALQDEHDWGIRDEMRANVTEAFDADVKWRHWIGHRNVSIERFGDGWAAPAGNRCIMGVVGSTFCGVCSAELIRRMAHISEEVFHGRSPATYWNVFDYLVHPQHILSPNMIILRWNSSSLRMPYMGSDIFVNITFDVAPGAQIADRGAVWFTDEHQFMGWAVGTGSNQLILID